MMTQSTASAEVTVAAGLAGLSLLQGVPLSYLVPYPALLPPESLRFFFVDPNWMQALYAGYLSLGAQQTATPTLPVGPGLGVPYFGFLLNSALVVKWPTMSVVAADSQGNEILPLRLDLLGQSLMIGLYQAVPASLTLSQPHEGLDLGFSSLGPTQYQQLIRYFDAGMQGTAGTASSTAVQFTPRAQGDLVDFNGVFTAMVAAVNGEEGAFAGETLTQQSWGLQLVQEPDQTIISISIPA